MHFFVLIGIIFLEFTILNFWFRCIFDTITRAWELSYIMKMMKNNNIKFVQKIISLIRKYTTFYTYMNFRFGIYIIYLIF